ncbi:MAG: restriction endonuclease subunit S [Corynebacterium variabile]|uniref:restriction endonuclease subunit S n=1 Tax=Corynebacterium variabile TaxID=1727 RepID=UPI003F918B45
MTTTLSDIGEIFDGPHATPKRLTSGSKMFLNISSLNQGRLDLDQSDWISDDEFAKWTRRVTPQPGDLLFSYETRLGEAALMPTGIDACLGRRMALLRPDTTVVDSQFLLYFWLSPYFKQLIDQRAIHGATVDRIPLSELGDWPVTLPTLKDQHAIAEVLSALDDKIAASSAIIGSAKDLACAIAQQSQNMAPLGELASIVKNSVSPEHFSGKYVNHYSLPAFDAGHSELELADNIKSAKNHIAIPVVLVSKLNPRIPRIWAINSADNGNILASPEFIALKPEAGTAAELWASLIAQNFTQGLLERVTGTTGSHQRVRPEKALEIEIYDTRTLTNEQRESLESLSLLRDALIEESRALAATRDELLPLLMSGKITVTDAKKRITE